ncbi:MAG: aminotransferase [Gammaproteobacteria bacterium]|nr:MAG: aminotransferase [Gammaproteobacteria bacterium]RLA53374.1 MAG: aminotransferase [Gammaproteobacteria bacterium]
MQQFQKSTKLDSVCYDIRGPVLDQAHRLEEEGHRILKLNIGNPAPFGFEAPDEIIQDVIMNLVEAQGYSHSKGIFSARKAIMQRCQIQGIADVDIEDIILGNGVSELIVMSMQALLNDGDEILIPTPDYPLWTAAVTLAGGKAVHYRCDESADWQPDLDDLASKISKRTKGIVVINPNNPTGAVYSKETLEQIIELARVNNLIIFADEIYDRIVYDDAVHWPMGSLADDILTITFNGLSKNYRLAGFRSGWLITSGTKHLARNYIQGIEMLASMRLCANVPAMYAIQTALGGYQSVEDLVKPGGRFHDQRDLGWEQLNAMPGVSCVKPKGALYLFPRLDPDVYPIKDDEQLVLDLLLQEKMLIVQGTAFNWIDSQHYRLVFLPRQDELNDAMSRFSHFLTGLREK